MSKTFPLSAAPQKPWRAIHPWSLHPQGQLAAVRQVKRRTRIAG